MMPGGLTEAKPATPKVQEIAEEVKSQLEQRTNRTYPTFKAVEYKTQVVAGLIYYIKVYVSEEEYIHLKVFQSLPNEKQPLDLMAFQAGKTRDDALTFFD
ncbi:cystatin-A1-like [Tachyglossus aculeatus]|uniref:cystatin-A1-like n=1 Tax=Tachyglossus aculeatus TaxID=9261 RepID=UPI0018F6A928|nr:cystatin-A1-like [Tachyglossus aculeatus]XP_038614497.1 cystatin-A1-like [Tachyglossus aculeatus]XP_038614498.1 cystatin-A1-like [Tachyglossus aculeatus]